MIEVDAMRYKKTGKFHEIEACLFGFLSVM